MMTPTQASSESGPPCFLTDEAIRKEICHLVGGGEDLYVAVAYWGKAGAEQTGIAERAKAGGAGNVQVLCDLASGACNPEEIERLQAAGVEVKTLDDLHAKVWITASVVIVGSANASTSGLADETRLGSKVEAALLSRHRELARTIRTWFDGKWKKARPVDDEALQEARQLWKKRRRVSREVAPAPSPAPSASKRSLLDRVVAVAEELWRDGQPSDVTLQAVRVCNQDKAWRHDYAAYLNSDPALREKRRGDLHRAFGRNVKGRLRATSGRDDMPAGKGDLVGTYTELLDNS